MNLKINKNILAPILIIVLAIAVGSAALGIDLSGLTAPINRQQSLRVLETSIPGMACSGCAASIESYVKSMPGVVKASV